jgi:fluoride ion exporter CrcB/FEX
MARFLWICLGGAAGTGARYLLSGWLLRTVEKVRIVKYSPGTRDLDR